MWGHQINKTKAQTHPAIKSSSKGFIYFLKFIFVTPRVNAVYFLDQ